MTSATCWHYHLNSQMIPNTTNENDIYGQTMPSYDIYPIPEYTKSQDKDGLHLAIYTCANCGYPNIAELQPAKSPFDDLDIDDVKRWLPIEPIGKQYKDVPVKIASIASEAHKCFQIGAYRAAVALSRTALEGIIGEQEDKPSSRVLYQRIQSLAESGKIKARTSKAATAIRLCGNASVHNPTADIDREFAEIVVEVLDSVIDDLYANPGLVSRAIAYANSHGKPESDNE